MYMRVEVLKQNWTLKISETENQDAKTSPPNTNPYALMDNRQKWKILPRACSVKKVPGNPNDKKSK